jgi:hypothetical protein
VNAQPIASQCVSAVSERVADPVPDRFSAPSVWSCGPVSVQCLSPSSERCCSGCSTPIRLSKSLWFNEKGCTYDSRAKHVCGSVNVSPQTQAFPPTVGEPGTTGNNEWLSHRTA